VRRSGRETESGTKIRGRECLHTDKEPATVAFTTTPLLDIVIELFPAAHIEVADAKVGSLTDRECVLQGWKQFFFYVIKNAWHVTSQWVCWQVT
jgi:hypothetical protein